MINSFLEKVKSIPYRVERYRFRREIKQVYTTPPVPVSDTADFLIVSQVHRSAVEMSLLSLKTFMKQFDSCALELIDDGSLTEENKNAYYHHLPGVKIIPISQVDLMDCPPGGTWERLAYVVQRSAEKYVIQIDSDTLTFGDLGFVKDRIASNKPFLVGQPSYAEPVPVVAMAELASSWKDLHIQSISESYLERLYPEFIEHYARGCSGFTGFPKNGVVQETMNGISKVMEQAVGRENWRRWGTEQVTSNILLSTFDDVVLLPWPDYQNYGFPFADENEGAQLIHFIGTYRHAGSYYRTRAMECIAQLNQEEQLHSLEPSRR
jgi:RNase P protein component